MKTYNDKIIGLIPARGNSKGISRKNLLNIRNKPLIYYTIRAALNSKYISQSFVSSENNEILKISQEYGIGILKRPKQLSSDYTSMESVIVNSLEQLERMKLKFNILILLQPTSPLRDSHDIDKAISLFMKSGASALISVYEPDHSPYKAFKLGNKGFITGLVDDHVPFMRRQDLPKAYIPNGAIYIIKIPEFIRNHSLLTDKTIPYIMPISKSIDVDTTDDIEILKQHLKKVK